MKQQQENQFKLRFDHHCNIDWQMHLLVAFLICDTYTGAVRNPGHKAVLVPFGVVPLHHQCPLANKPDRPLVQGLMGN